MKTLVYVVGFAAVSANLQPGEKPPECMWCLWWADLCSCQWSGTLRLEREDGGTVCVVVRVCKEEEEEEEKKKKRVEKEPVKKESVWQQASSWLIQTLSRFLRLLRVVTPMCATLPADMTQQLAASAATVKTYESIAIVTEDKETMPSILPQISEDIAEATYDLEMKPPPPQEDPRGAGTASC
ncbi:hypothetical protein GQ600_21146 [Phytophthora cactorum]|nr:hypothetical protein GQ600_21146 [Phytophthora cactorum]